VENVITSISIHVSDPNKLQMQAKRKECLQLVFSVILGFFFRINDVLVCPKVIIFSSKEK